MQQNRHYIFHHTLKCVAALRCETSISGNYRKFDACVVINDKSQGSVATRLRCGGLFSNYFTYGFTVEFAGQTIFKICEHLAKLQASY